MNVGGYQAVRTRPRLRAAVNAWLEEISFRTGMITAAIVLVPLLTIAAAGAYVATAGHGRTAGTLSAGHHPNTSSAAAVVPASPSEPAPPSASAKPKAQPPVPARTTSPQPAVTPQPQTQAGSPVHTGPQYGWRNYGGTSLLGEHPYGDGPWFDDYGSGYGGPRYGGSGFPGSGWG